MTSQNHNHASKWSFIPSCYSNPKYHAYEATDSPNYSIYDNILNVLHRNSFENNLKSQITKRKINNQSVESPKFLSPKNHIYDIPIRIKTPSPAVNYETVSTFKIRVMNQESTEYISSRLGNNSKSTQTQSDKYVKLKKEPPIISVETKQSVKPIEHFVHLCDIPMKCNKSVNDCCFDVLIQRLNALDEADDVVQNENSKIDKLLKGNFVDDLIKHSQLTDIHKIVLRLFYGRYKDREEDKQLAERANKKKQFARSANRKPVVSSQSHDDNKVCKCCKCRPEHRQIDSELVISDELVDKMVELILEILIFNSDNNSLVTHSKLSMVLREKIRRYSKLTNHKYQPIETRDKNQ